MCTKEIQGGNTVVLRTGEKPAIFRNGGIWKEHNIKKPYNLGLEMGGGIGREVVLGGTAVLSRAVLGTEFVGRTRNLFGYDVIGIVQSGAVVALPGCRDWFKRHLVTS